MENINSEHNTIRRTAIVAGTPWQIIGAISLALSGECGCSSSDIDLYLRIGFAYAQHVSDSINQMGIFRHVIPIQCEKHDTLDERKVEQRIPNALIDDIHTQHTIVSDKYDIIVFSYYYDTVFDLISISNDAQIWMYDDGLGSYSGSILNAIVNLGMPMPERIYLCEPQLACDSISEIAHRLPLNLANPEHVSIITKVFNVDFDALSNLYAGRDIVLLTQPIDGITARREAIESTIDIIQQLGVRAIIRKHPRDNYTYESDFPVDDSSVPWEIACTLGIITSNKVLIATASTAQVTPRIITNSIPTVVILADLYEELARDEATCMTIPIIEKAYTGTGALRRPKTLDELKNILMNKLC